MKRTTPWSYQKGSTLLHRLPAGFKLVFLLALSFAAFIPGADTRVIILHLFIALLIFLLALTAKISPAALLRGSGPLFFIVLAVFLFSSLEISPPGFNSERIMGSLIFLLRIGTAFASGSLLFAVTTTFEIRKSLRRAEAFLHLEKINISLHLSLMLGFLKSFFEVWEDLNLAWKSRGGEKTFSLITTLIPLAIERMMRKAARTAEALEARGVH